MAELDEVQNQIDSFKVVEKNKTLDDQIDKFEKELDPIKEKDFIKYVKMDEEEEKDIRLLQESLGSGISVKKSGFEKVKKPKKEEEQDWAEIVKEDVLFPEKKESAYAGDVSQQYKDGSGSQGAYTSNSFDDSIQGYSSGSKYQ